MLNFFLEHPLYLWLISKLRQLRLQATSRIKHASLNSSRIRSLCTKLLYPRTAVQLVCLSEQSNLNPKAQISPANKSTIYAPCLLGAHENHCANTNTHITSAPAINFYTLKQACCSAYSSHILTNDTLYMDTLATANFQEANYATGWVWEHDHQKALLKKPHKAPIEVSSAIFLGGNGAGNYYHWLIEILPKLPLLLDQLPQLPKSTRLLLPKEAKTLTSYSTSLKLLAPELEASALYLSPSEIASVDQLHLLTPPNNLVFNLRQPKIHLQYFYYHQSALTHLRNTLLAAYSQQVPNNTVPARVFLARKRGTRRHYNQSQVEALACSAGFQPLYLEELSFFEQVKIFQQAEVIIGPSGAAWSNLLFARPGLRGLSWLPEPFTNFAAFSTLAAYFGCQLRFIQAQPYVADYIHTSYWVDPQQLQASLEELL